MGRRTILVLLLLVAIVVAVPFALRSDTEDPTQYELVVRDSAAAAGREAGVDVEAVVRRAADAAVAVLPRRSRVRIEVRADPAKALPETGVGGETNPGGVFLSVERPLRQGAEHWLRRLVAHELHRAVRLERTQIRSTLEQALVAEGLADHFARELYPGGPESPWTDALSDAQEAELWARAKAHGSGAYDHREWFLGEGELPRWAGYTLGYRIVGAYLERTGRSAADAAADHPATIVAVYEQ